MSQPEAAEPAAPAAITLQADDVAALEQALAWSKALAAPTRLALLGALAARPGEAVALADLAARAGSGAARLDREIAILAEAGLVEVVEWTAPGPGQEPRPARVAFNRAYLQAAPGVIAALHRAVAQARPEPAAPAPDERTRVLERLFQGGRLLSWPAQYKRQFWVTEAVARAFEPGRAYSEREVDAILKDVYAVDHCTLRRFLVDLHFLERDHNIYWKAAEQPQGATP